MIQIFNTLTRQKEDFIPLHKGQVNMYVCGPTVYNYIHIGNARSVVAFDTIRRYFEYKGYQVKYVSNFTDVDDKMINEAAKEGITVPELGNRFINAYFEDTKPLNVERATVNPRATENISDIVDFVADLVDKGFAYESAGDVYYRARKFPDYTQLVHESLDDLENGASDRVDDGDNAKKEDPIDFALWKAAKPGEISWQSPWGMGRPGWHIECSVMSTKYLGDTFDIHGGGQDLIFPHHTNEIAQSEAHTGKKFARYWMHNGFVTVGDENEKMSKSLGNFVTLREMNQREDPQAVRFFMATTQYRRPIQYTSGNLQDAKNNLARLQTTFNNLNYRMSDAKDGQDEAIEAQAKQQQVAFENAMDDDFNVQNGIAAVYELAKLINVYLNESTVAKKTLVNLKTLLSTLLSVFGIELTDADTADEEIQALIDERLAARKNKDFQRSDDIRDELKARGIILEDTPQGTRWRKETND
ncbi:cysteine--tRNA ligase [Furfurilactobacillus milii]|uniref:Cysteine--tRNA ligase n=1 Tax=Furfurilactobacillus milii TaxID=2888272 RepID=A0A6N9I7A3_9LACO|nr:cysteine--tRNA ligase [Furfurilactobacillus milii]